MQITKREQTIKRIAKDYKLDPRVIKVIVDFPIRFAKYKINDPDNIRPVRVRYFGTFAPKPKLVNGLVKKNNHIK